MTSEKNDPADKGGAGVLLGGEHRQDSNGIGQSQARQRRPILTPDYAKLAEAEARRMGEALWRDACQWQRRQRAIEQAEWRNRHRIFAGVRHG